MSDTVLETEEGVMSEVTALFDTQYLDLYKRLSLYYQGCLQKSSKAQEYLHSRGVDLETAVRYELGYAPEDNVPLLTKLRSCGYSPSDLTILGVTSDSGYATFRDRLMFPIVNFAEEVVGFGGRYLGTHADAKSKGIPKYLNTKENPKFKKYKTFYSGSFENRELRHSGEYLLVEGYLDVIKACESLRAHGKVRSALSPMSSNITKGHIKELLEGCVIVANTLNRCKSDIVVCFDNDSSGITGSKKACKTLEESFLDIDVRYLPIPDGKDVDEFVTNHGSAFFCRLLELARSMTEHEVIDILHKPLPATCNASDERIKRVKECTRIIGESCNNRIRNNVSGTTRELIKQIAYYWFSSNPGAVIHAESSILRETLKIRRGVDSSNLYKIGDIG